MNISAYLKKNRKYLVGQSGGEKGSLGEISRYCPFQIRSRLLQIFSVYIPSGLHMNLCLGPQPELR
jgi:hypothetical protein